ncbi:type II toxin-antitoxin system PemK/MazF family toxin [Saxibacter everestensis]|uniref:Type II toxin-antitoxin system PemK/MazF family toxin n=1 Tax=Saxibacter everestensis TaxID=2909229 RepID=A0ABY8QXX0_9MICO|nr:type II toxin-antitoxin system PemK/MazF family toxin [Brevibacteriaceae bacterium ZFBP1038]
MGLREFAGRLVRRAAEKGAQKASRLLIDQVNKASDARGGPRIPVPENLRPPKQRKPTGDVIPGEVVTDDVRADRTARSAPARPRSGYPGDFVGDLDPAYSANPDGAPDPGEIVWGWAPFEDDPSQGKDRPMLLVGRDGEFLLALMLSSRDHVDAGGPGLRSVNGRYWLDIGSGPWDPKGRPSEVRLDRVIRLRETGIRREGAAMPRKTFDQVVQGMREARLAR